MSFGSDYWNRVKMWAAGLPLARHFVKLRAQADELLRLPPPRKPDDVPNTKQYEEHPSRAYMDLKMAFPDIGRINRII